MGAARQSYRPANGSEGADFMALWCDRCRADAGFGEGDGCRILAATMAYPIGHPGYPEEWIYGDDGRGKCTMFTSICGVDVGIIDDARQRTLFLDAPARTVAAP